MRYRVKMNLYKYISIFFFTYILSQLSGVAAAHETAIVRDPGF